MKRILLTLLLGLGCGLAAHFGWYVLRAPAATSTNEQLAWLKQTLQLSDAQYAAIQDLHAQSSPRLRALAAQVRQMRSELEAYETARRTTGQVDFLEFAHFVETRRAIDRECAESTRALIAASTQVMTPEQRRQYLAMVDQLASTLPSTN